MMHSTFSDGDSGSSSELVQALSKPGELVVLSLPAPACTAEAAFEALGAGDGLIWDPPRGPMICGAGASHTIHARGSARFEQVQKQAAALWSEIQHHALGRSRPPLILLGGFAFDAGQADVAPWAEFGDARFVLPRLAYVRSEREAWLSLAVGKSEIGTPAARDAALSELSRARSALAARASRVPLPPRAAEPRLALSLPDRAIWTRNVTAIKAGIESGDFEKIVLAHRALVEAPRLPELPELVARLTQLAPECVRFAFRWGGTSFIGATPERLISKHGLELGAEAIAGSIKPGGEARRLELLGSHKDLREHELVVRELLRVLTPLSARIWHAPSPEIRELKHVAHLYTPIRAELATDLHVLELVRALHPTSAVGGLPRDRALEWLGTHEQEPRGWYAGPVGWFDAAGNGEFHVALRSGLVRGGTAHVYAGAGIVEDSDAASEYAETQLKMAALIAALGGGS
jgi:menaquinone-specific isochorismate synthase